MSNTKKIALTGIGIALFVVLSLCLQVPVFQNYYLCLGYIVMMTWLVNVGTVSGTLVAVLGTVLYCILISGLRGLPGWATGNIAIGLIVGYYLNNIRTGIKQQSKPSVIFVWIVDVVVMTFAVAAGILLIKSVVEVVLYSQPMLVRITTNMAAYAADCVTLYIGLPIALTVKKIMTKSGHIANAVSE